MGTSSIKAYVMVCNKSKGSGKNDEGTCTLHNYIILHLSPNFHVKCGHT